MSFQQSGNVVSDDEGASSRPSATTAPTATAMPTATTRPAVPPPAVPPAQQQQMPAAVASAPASSAIAPTAAAAAAPSTASAPAPAPAAPAATNDTGDTTTSITTTNTKTTTTTPEGYPLTNITGGPGIHDVYLGRGGGINNKPGNIRFRDLVRQHKVRYIEARKIDKPKVAVDVVRIWRNLRPPGRFLERTRVGGVVSEPPVYHDVGDKKAQLKASQCLRERTPEVMRLVQEQELKRRSEESMTDILIPVCPVGASMPAATDVLRWTHDDDYATSTIRNVEFRSLMTSRAYRVIPLYYIQNCQRRCVIRTATVIPPTRTGGDSASGNSSGVESLALLAELKNSYEEEEKETDRNKKRKIAQERGTKLVPTNTYRYSWVRGIPNGRIELTRTMDQEMIMIDNIYPQLIPGEANLTLPRPLEIGSR